MGKRKRTNQAHQPVEKKQLAAQNGVLTPPGDTPIIPTNVDSVVLPEDIEITIETLNTLTQYPSLIKSKPCKDLRTAVYDFRQSCTTGLNSTSESNNLTARISAALTDAKFTDALILLAEMRIRMETPTLGALCRWVRELDVVTGVSGPVNATENHALGKSPYSEELVRVLDAVLRVTGPTDPNCGGEIRRQFALQEAWDLRDEDSAPQQTRSMVVDRSIFDSHPDSIKNSFSILETTPANLRKPPNHHPAVLYTCGNDTIPLGDAPLAERHQHPTVPNLSLIKNVLSPEECTSIIAAGESVEFIPDAPVCPVGQDTSILAHNFYWMIDQAFHDKLWARVRNFVPENVSGKQVRGINRRFRVYRYVPGAEYRCHIDGAWPPSGIDAATGAYQYDSSPASARQSSLFTFLIYLNDEFSGGETTFYIPSVREGIINAYPVKPVMGSVAVFPHGEAQGALLHEGSGVTKGAKYVIRTDVEYDVDAS